MLSQKKVGVAVNRGYKSAAALIYALKNLLIRGESVTLLHVYPPILYIPLPVGKFHVDQLDKEVVDEYRAKKNLKIDNYLKVFVDACQSHGVTAKLVKVEDSPVEKALVQQVFDLKLTELVLGKSYTGNAFTRSFYGPGISDYVSRNAPKFCAISIISKEQPISRSSSQISNSSSSSSQDIQSDPPTHTAIEVHNGQHVQEQISNMQYARSSVSVQSNSSLLSPKSYNSLLDSESHISSPTFGNLQAANKSRLVAHFSEERMEPWSRTSSPSSNSFPAPMQLADQEKDRVPRHYKEPSPYRHPQLGFLLDNVTNDMKGTDDANRKTHLNGWRRMEQVWEQQVIDEDITDIEYNEEKLNDGFQVQESNRNEATFNQGFKGGGIPAESPTAYPANEVNQQTTFREYSIDEIRSGTRSFSEESKIGEGKHGVIYKGRLDFKDAAIKVLEEEGLQGSKEFFSEIEFLGHLEHQNVVPLLGYCGHERVYLAYEYMAKGSLEDHLFGKDKGESSLPWHKRFQIAAHIATALDYLHNMKPNAIIHCDIKPSNIFLDYNNVSKLGDVGIARLVAEHAKSNAANKDMLPVGTFSYIDPEYQTSGIFDTKSDIYALGIVLLQLLTGKFPLGVHDYVETAMDSGTFADVLDPSAGEWPLGKAKEVACLALQCAEMRRKHRPDLEQILQILNKIRAFAEEFASEDASQILNKRRPTSYAIPPRLATRATRGP